MKTRFSSLDGWRGISIIFVLAGHLLPLGPKSWQMNAAVASSGMVIFFILSGFLITTILLKNQNVVSFLIRRFLRIIPLAWLVLGISLVCISAERKLYLPHFLFYANWEPMALTFATGRFWSLCVEMQFYVLMAFLIIFFKKRTFILLPFIGISVTLLRIYDGVEIAINTYYRIDEIFAGCILALLYNEKDNSFVGKFFCRLSPLCLLPLVILSAHPNGGFLQYVRPYLALLLVGATLFNEKETWLNRGLNNKFLSYTASISYALYVIHGGLNLTWLGDGDKFERYLKRPLLFLVTFLLAHISTFYYEKHWISLGRKLTNREK